MKIPFNEKNSRVYFTFEKLESSSPKSELFCPCRRHFSKSVMWLFKDVKINMDFATAKLNFLGIFSAKNDFSPYFTFVSIFLLLKSLKMFFSEWRRWLQGARCGDGSSESAMDEINQGGTPRPWLNIGIGFSKTLIFCRDQDAKMISSRQFYQVKSSSGQSQFSQFLPQVKEAWVDHNLPWFLS